MVADVPRSRILVTDAVAQGAELALGGTAIGGRGYYFAPTVLARVPESARVMNDEPFGPIAATATFSTAEQAVEQANRLPYGLGSYVWTADRARANVVSRLIEAGMVGINRFGLGGPDTFFGGVKESGYGSEGGPEAVQDYQVRKLSTKDDPSTCSCVSARPRCLGIGLRARAASRHLGADPDPGPSARSRGPCRK